MKPLGRPAACSRRAALARAAVRDTLPQAGAVLDDERATEGFGELLREEPRLDVGAAAGRLADDDAHGLGGMSQSCADADGGQHAPGRKDRECSTTRRNDDCCIAKFA